jgi:hypothetical protein
MKKSRLIKRLFSFVKKSLIAKGLPDVPKAGLEPAHLLRLTPLKRACLPISPLRQAQFKNTKFNIQNIEMLNVEFFGAQDWTRTSTPCGTTPSK